MLDARAPQPQLPGFPELPIEPPKTTQAERLARMGYIAPKDRRCCANCKHFDPYWLNPDSIAAREMPRCKRGGFPVLRGGICDEHSPTKA